MAATMAHITHYPSNSSFAHEKEEELISTWPVVSSPVHIMVILPLYLLFIYKTAPQFMASRKPFELKNTIMVYNIFQVVCNLYIVYYYFFITKNQPFSFWNNPCYPISAAQNFNPVAKLELLDGMYLYYTNKIVDLLDTVFFALRKKDSQITFLHVFHHITMIISTWLSVILIREEISAIMAVINSIIHVVMYSYYFLSSLGPAVQKHLWWKKYITKLQIVQFVTILTLLAKLSITGCKCNSLFWGIWIFNVSSFLALFTNFYLQSYTKKPKSS